MIKFVRRGDTLLMRSAHHPARNRDDLRAFMRQLTATSPSTFRSTGSAARTRNGPCCLRRSVGCGVTCERCEQFPDAMVAVERVPKRHCGVELVAVAPPLSNPFEVSGLFQFGHDALCGSLRNSDLSGDIPHPHVRVLRHTHQHVRVVREKGPSSHDATVPRSKLILLNIIQDCKYLLCYSCIC